MHLVIYFCGTGNPGSTFRNRYNRLSVDQSVKLVFVAGCDHQEVCNAGLFPDLSGFAQRFVKTLFKKDDKDRKLRVKTPDVNSLRLGIQDTTLLNEDALDNIESITLCGYSRGSVTCFEVAKQLNAVAPEIPVDIVADQPVPGNLYQWPGSNAASIADCSGLKNLRNVSIILGAYTGSLMHEENDYDKEFVNPIHRAFFSQIVPKLPRTVKRDLIVIPIESHHERRPNSPDGEQHMIMQLAKHLYMKKLVSRQAVKEAELNAKSSYLTDQDFGFTRFPHVSKLQSFFGIEPREVYRHTDKLHPLQHQRKGMTFKDEETILEWWNRQEKNASRFSTKLTKQLVEKIKEVSEKKTGHLELFVQADKWLLLKENTSSSRYNQVEALRNNLFHQLRYFHHHPKEELARACRRNMHGTNYFLRHWNVASKASFFRTEETRILEEAFKKHARSFYSEENDRELLRAINTWIDVKQHTNSKRFEYVVRIQETLSQSLEACYPRPELESEPEPERKAPSSYLFS